MIRPLRRAFGALAGEVSGPFDARFDAIVVLGAKVHDGGRPSPAVEARVAKGVALFQRGVAPLLVFSGGGRQQGPSEAAVMRGLALAAGVPEAACLLEDASMNTAENARRTVPLLKARGLRSVVVVTDAYHLLRARQHFRRAGLDVAVCAAPLGDRGIGTRELASLVLHEVGALVFDPRTLFARKP